MNRAFNAGRSTAPAFPPNKTTDNRARRRPLQTKECISPHTRQGGHTSQRTETAQSLEAALFRNRVARAASWAKHESKSLQGPMIGPMIGPGTGRGKGCPQLDCSASVSIARRSAWVILPAFQNLNASALTAWTYSRWFVHGPLQGTSCAMLQPSVSTTAPGGVSGQRSSPLGTPSESQSHCGDNGHILPRTSPFGNAADFILTYQRPACSSAICSEVTVKPPAYIRPPPPPPGYGTLMPYAGQSRIRSPFAPGVAGP